MNAKAELSWVRVCRLEDLTDNLGICAKVGEHQVAIFKVKDVDGHALYAIDNHDPISKANVLSRGIVGDVKGHDVVASPIYKQHFDLRIGQCLEAEVKIPTYQVRENAGNVEVLME